MRPQMAGRVHKNAFVLLLLLLLISGAANV